MRVHIGSDHAGFELKNRLVEALSSDGHEVVDHGPVEYDAEDDYPIFCIAAAEAVVADPGSPGHRGGRFRQRGADRREQGQRACARPGLRRGHGELGRLHNDSNVMGIGARLHSPDEAVALARPSWHRVQRRGAARPPDRPARGVREASLTSGQRRSCAAAGRRSGPAGSRPRTPPRARPHLSARTRPGPASRGPRSPSPTRRRGRSRAATLLRLAVKTPDGGPRTAALG